jgi:hypothetical protein
MTSTTNAPQTHTCSRCSGSGYLPNFRHIEGGVCYACKGSGKLTSNHRPIATPRVVEDKVMTSDRYPGWEIRKQGACVHNMTKGNWWILVSESDIGSKVFTASVMAPDGSGVLFTGSVVDAVQFCQS